MKNFKMKKYLLNFSKWLFMWIWVFIWIFIWLYGLYAFNWGSITTPVQDGDALTASKWNDTIQAITQNIDSLQTSVAAASWWTPGWWQTITKKRGNFHNSCSTTWQPPACASGWTDLWVNDCYLMWKIDSSYYVMQERTCTRWVDKP